MSLILYEMKLKKKRIINLTSYIKWLLACVTEVNIDLNYFLIRDRLIFNSIRSTSAQKKKCQSLSAFVHILTQVLSLHEHRSFVKVNNICGFLAANFFSILYHNGIYAWSLDGLDKVNISVNKKSYLNITLLKDR